MAQSENLSFRVSPQTRERFAAICSEKNIPQVVAFESLVKFLANQNDVAQSMILGQLKPTPELLRLALSRAGRK